MGQLWDAMGHYEVLWGTMVGSVGHYRALWGTMGLCGACGHHRVVQWGMQVQLGVQMSVQMVRGVHSGAVGGGSGAP